MLDIIAFDADDTLWDNETRYAQAKERVQEVLRAYGSPEAAGELLDDIEVRNVAIYGYGIKSFILSIIETAIQFSAGSIPGSQIQAILDLAREMLTVPVDVYERAEDTLAILSTGYPLMLITKGDTIEQEMKIARTGLAKYFKYIEIVGIKTQATYEQILRHYHLRPEGFLMVGNSMRSDILPVLRLGGLAVYIPQENTWSHENSDEELPDIGKYFALEHLWQLPDLIRRLETS